MAVVDIKIQHGRRAEGGILRIETHMCRTGNQHTYIYYDTDHFNGGIGTSVFAFAGNKIPCS